MSRHTPGPWGFDEYRRIVDPQGEIIEVNGVSMPCGYVPPTHVAWANSALIAASPELLEALKAMLANGGTSSTEWMPLKYIKQARAAIAKAEPKS